MKVFIDDYRSDYGGRADLCPVGICKELPIAPSTYYLHVAPRVNPKLRPARVQQDEGLNIQISRIWEGNFRIYGARKIWWQLQREGHDVARCRSSGRWTSSVCKA